MASPASTDPGFETVDPFAMIGARDRFPDPHPPAGGMERGRVAGRLEPSGRAFEAGRMSYWRFAPKAPIIRPTLPCTASNRPVATTGALSSSVSWNWPLQVAVV